MEKHYLELKKFLKSKKFSETYGRMIYKNREDILQTFMCDKYIDVINNCKKPVIYNGYVINSFKNYLYDILKERKAYRDNYFNEDYEYIDNIDYLDIEDNENQEDEIMNQSEISQDAIDIVDNIDRIVKEKLTKTEQDLYYIIYIHGFSNRKLASMVGKSKDYICYKKREITDKIKQEYEREKSKD